MPPSDRLASPVVRTILQPGKSRDRLTQGIYISTDPDDPLGRIENAYIKRMAVAKTEVKVRADLKKLGIKRSNDLELIEKGISEGILSVEEIAPLREAYDAMLQAIAVDEF
jgi:acyl-CoA dehydrogenase